jgi:hypothetical protein
MQPKNKLLNQYDIFWVVTPCSFVDGYQRFGATLCLHVQEKNSAFEGGGCSFL